MSGANEYQVFGHRLARQGEFTPLILEISIIYLSNFSAYRDALPVQYKYQVPIWDAS